jgi:hypothetical protein
MGLPAGPESVGTSSHGSGAVQVGGARFRAIRISLPHGWRASSHGWAVHSGLLAMTKPASLGRFLLGGAAGQG